MKTEKITAENYLQQNTDVLNLIKERGNVKLNVDKPFGAGVHISLPEDVRQLIYTLDGEYLGSRQRQLRKENAGMEVIFIDAYEAYTTTL